MTTTLKSPPVKKLVKNPRIPANRKKIISLVEPARPNAEKSKVFEKPLEQSDKKSFVIETLKWKWASTVKNPNVYRDDEFIRSSSKSDALADIDYLLNRPQGLTYTITVFREGEYFTYYRHSMPCLGGLVKYSDSHGKDKYWMNPYFPRDIKVAFPEGNIIFIGICRDGTDKIFENPYNEFIFSEESPWIGAFGDKTTVIFKPKYFVLTNMDGPGSDPTILYHFIRYGDMMGGYYGTGQKNVDPKVQILLSKTNFCDPRRLCGQKPIKTSAGSWAENFGYTRGYNESIFKTSMPCKFKDFKNFPTTNYPPSFSFSNEYFKNEMKNKFGVDITVRNEKLHPALLESWEYFKEKSGELDEWDKQFRD